MSNVVLIALGVFMVGGAVMVVFSRDIVGAIIASGLVSLFASIVYLILGAPDVAMTEAAIGSGLTTVVFLFSWSRITKQIRRRRETDSDTAGGIASDPGASAPLGAGEVDDA